MTDVDQQNTPTTTLDLDEVRATLADNGIDGPDAPYNPKALAAMRVADALLAEVVRLHERIDKAHDALTRIDDGDDDDFTTLESTVDHVVRRCRAIAASEAEAVAMIDRLQNQIDRLENEQATCASCQVFTDPNRTCVRPDRADGGCPDCGACSDCVDLAAQCAEPVEAEA